MARFSLATYTIRLREKYTGNYKDLDFLGRGEDLQVAFGQYLRTRQADYSIDSSSQSMLRVQQVTERGRSFSGRIATGEYGYEATLYDVRAAIVSYRRTADDAEMMPFYFLAYLPAGRDEGVLILQRRSQYGIRTVFLRDFVKYFEGSFPDLKVEINPLIPSQLIDQYLQNGRLTKVRFIRFHIPSDVTDAYDTGGHVEELGRVELSVWAGRNRGLPVVDRVREVLNGRRNINEMIELSSFDYDNVKVEIDLGGSRRTLDLSNVMKLRAHYDISSEVKVGADGHPEFGSVDGIARKLLSSLEASLVRDVDDLPW